MTKYIKQLQFDNPIFNMAHTWLLYWMMWLNISVLITLIKMIHY